MKLERTTILNGGNLAKIIAVDDERMYAVSRGGVLAESTDAIEWRIVGNLGIRAGDLCVEHGEHRVCIVGDSGAVVWWERGQIARETPVTRADLRAIAVTARDHWIIAGQHAPLSGALLAGGRGNWRELRSAAIPAALTAVGSRPFGQQLLAGHRGFLAWHSGDKVVPIESPTRHPLRVAVAFGDGFLVGGGGWAQEMPILMEVAENGIRPLVSSGGGRVITGIVILDRQLWIAENRREDGLWTAMLTRLDENTSHDSVAIAGEHFFGATVFRGEVVAWGSNGLLARMALP